MRKILEAAVLRSKTIEAFEEQFVAHELTGAESMGFSTKLTEKKDAAFAWLFRHKITKPDGSPAFNDDEAQTLATGSPAAFLPLFLAVTGFSNVEEKKASNPQSDSTTDSPSPSDAPPASS